MEDFKIIIRDGEGFATRNEVQYLFEIPRKTLSDAIKTLKQDGLVNGAESRHVAKDGKMRLTEVYNLDEIIAIG